MLELKILFWAAVVLVFYTYAGYPFLLALGTRWKAEDRNKCAAAVPSVTLIIPACNEQRWIARKIENTLALAYPRDRLEIVVASDGSTDETVKIGQQYEPQGVRVAAFPMRLGKQGMLNRLVPRSRCEVVVMTDANALLAPDALQQLVRPFADSQVGCAIGRRVCVVQQRSIPSLAESFYWRYESWIKRAESRWHSCLAATGQLYAIRRGIFPHVERVGEDFYIPMKVLAETGLRIAYVPEAVVTIPAAANLSIEFERKTRAHVAFLISLPMLRELLIPGRSPVWWQFTSHHVLRMLVPPALPVAFLASAAMASANSFYFFVTAAQILFGGLAFLGWVFTAFGRRPKIFYFPFYFVFVQLALAQAWIRWPRGKYDYAWRRTERLTDAS
ncbi:MAG TPA: glycosyltransferase family 2 protein [Candidatus Acidoferrales bacterium]|nr:glycosyltransferase family 2 protein [Candidatus Acidoferrales bacterium]